VFGKIGNGNVEERNRKGIFQNQPKRILPSVLLSEREDFSKKSVCG